MNTNHRAHRLLAVLLAGLIGAGPALAQPSHAGGGGGKHGGGEKHQKHDKQDKHERKAKDDGHGKGGGKLAKGNDGKGAKPGGKAPQPGAYFTDRNRDAVRTYYASAGQGGQGCPPGLAKKNNGCMPPGQAKKWHVGQPLPSTVTFYTVPQQIIVTLPPVPTGHRYVQVAGDILLIAVGSRMVVDGISGLTGR